MKFKYKTSGNNLDLLRLLLASLVVILHLSDLTGNQLISDYSNIFEFASSRAVPGFFIISGFLIYMSYEKSTTLGDYYWKRLLRLAPAYIILIFISAIFLFFASSADAEQYFSNSWLDYVFYNLLFMNFISPELPGVFSDNIIQAVNGSLWTLKIEVMFYILVPILYKVASKFSALLVMMLIFIMSVVYMKVMNGLYLETGSQIYHQLSYQLPGQMMYFVSGILAYLYYDFLKKNIRYFLALALGIFYFDILTLDAIALTISLVFVFMILPFKVNLRKVGDMSYGVYIYHFPIIQVLVSNGYFIESPKVLILITYVLTFVAAFFSWHIIEKKSLLLKKSFKLNKKISGLLK